MKILNHDSAHEHPWHSYIYLASPYSSPDKLLKFQRFYEIMHVQNDLMNLGFPAIFGPIAMSHPLAQYAQIRTDWEFWKRNDEIFVQNAQEMWISAMPGWKESTGVNAEIAIAKRANVPIKLLQRNKYLDEYTLYVYNEDHTQDIFNN